MKRRPLPDLVGDPADVAFFTEQMASHRNQIFARTMRMLPSEPRCRMCRAPFGGGGGRIMRRFGFGPSRKNPTICNTCFEKAPMGGVELEIGVLFADVRGFTAMTEKMAPEDVARLMNRFYAAATEVLMQTAIIDKLVGDEVMALYIPFTLGEHWADHLVRDASALLSAVGYGTSDRWLDLAVGLDVGRAYVGNVGAGDVKDFTALGDVVNTASRLLAKAEGGQVVMSERLFGRLAHPPAGATPAVFELKGKQEPEPARVLDLSAAGAG
jgi:adenylate cyclase